MKRTLAACALALAAVDACALSLGEPEVRSGPGEALDLRFPVTLAPGEFIDPSCFKLAAEGTATAPRVAAGSVSLERSAGGTFLRLRTGASITDPAVAVGLVASCKGIRDEYRREFTVSVEAKKAAASAPSAAPSQSSSVAEAPSMKFEASSILPAIATLVARIGDTLESIAKAIFPDNAGARRSYIDALREANPPLAPLADNEPIPIDMPVALPDLRTFSKARHVPSPPRIAASEPPPPKEEAPEAAPAPKVAPPPRAAKKPKVRSESPAPPAPRETPMARPRAEPRVAKSQSPRAPASGDFVLKLSGTTMDLSASRGIDDRTRARLRERLMVLDADDQVSALLSLKQNVKDLETQVADLRLKLSEFPKTFPAPKAAPEPAQPAPEPPKVEAPPPKVEPPPTPKVEAPPPKVEPAPAPIVEATPPKIETPASKVEAPTVETAPPKVEAPPAKAASTQWLPADWLDYALWTLAIVFIAIAVLLALRLRRRDHGDGLEDTPDLRTATAAKAAEEEVEDDLPPAHEDDQIVVAEELPVDLEVAPDIPAPTAFDAAPRREIDADVDLPTHIPSNEEDLRRRYIEERFPEIGKGAISLGDADSVVKGARLFYEDGAIARAVELLQYAIERNPNELKSWLALFEIFRLEHLSGEFAELAGRFKAQHGKSEYWPKVQYFGREIDPGNELYREPPINNFETIGPAQAKKLAAASNVDPVTENWLGAPMDFENEVLANELRRTLMNDAKIDEQDLVPNPMPALRNIEMFNVA
ncbi:MAG TPA: hypothetical protein VKR38_00560 [Usitatibacter sp.]|nr:hypothetical protein [Usitatibacter sp.]